MENWGLAIYQELLFFYDNTSSSAETEFSVVNIIAHEVAHMWFGNWVTPKWWDGLWLNEGFATYMEYAGAHDVRPEWRMVGFEKKYNVIHFWVYT
jgi:aminopeptidase N